MLPFFDNIKDKKLSMFFNPNDLYRVLILFELIDCLQLIDTIIPIKRKEKTFSDVVDHFYIDIKK